MASSIISSGLFNLYLTNLSSPPLEIQLASYADDFTVLSKGQNIISICDDLNGDL